MIDPDSVPSTIKSAVESIEARLTEADRASILTSKASKYHFGIGMYIRNEWSLWSPDSPLKRDAVNTYRIAHPDDISGLILEWLFSKVKGEDFDPIKHCEVYHNHWLKYEISSLEAGGWEE